MDYNGTRPYSSLGNRTPSEYAANFVIEDCERRTLREIGPVKGGRSQACLHSGQTVTSLPVASGPPAEFFHEGPHKSRVN